MKEAAIIAFVGSIAMVSGALLQIAAPLQILSADKFNRDDAELLVTKAVIVDWTGTVISLAGGGLVTFSLTKASRESYLEALWSLKKTIDEMTPGKEKEDAIEDYKQKVEEFARKHRIKTHKR